MSIPSVVPDAVPVNLNAPAKVPNFFNQGLDKRKAIYALFPQAVPNTRAIDPVTLFVSHQKCLPKM